MHAVSWVMRFALRPAIVVMALLLATSAARATDAPLCGTRDAPPAIWEHVVWIWFENHGSDQVIGSPDAPFMNRTLAAGCGLATNAHNETHPSLPNYIAATSGLPPGALGRWKSDCNATGGCLTRVPSLFAQAPSWGAYAESMPKPCVHFFTGPYAASHNPAVYYRGLTDCAQHDVPYGRLRADLDSDTLPAFVFITPNMCHSMHNCSVRTGDAWLAKAIGALTASPAYQRGTMAIFVTFDEGEKGNSDRCTRNTSDAGCHIPILVVSPSTVPGTRSAVPCNHYSLLRTTEEMLGIPTYLGRARRERSMRSAFNL
jgi:phosphatidylinositol-3-phosphatase